MLGKWINGILISPSKNERKKLVITNPSDETLKFVMGYKETIIAPEPEYDVETQIIKMVLSKETETELLIDWEICDKPEDEEFIPVD